MFTTSQSEAAIWRTMREVTATDFTETAERQQFYLAVVRVRSRKTTLMSFALSDEMKRTLQNDMVRAQSVCINFLLDDRILSIPLGILAVLEKKHKLCFSRSSTQETSVSLYSQDAKVHTLMSSDGIPDSRGFLCFITGPETVHSILKWLPVLNWITSSSSAD